MARAARERAGAMRSDTLKFRPDTARSNVKQLTPRACAQSPMVDTPGGVLPGRHVRILDS